VTAFKQLPTKFAKLRRAIGEPMKKDKDPLGGPAMLEKLKGAIAPNSRRRSSGQRFDRLDRFVVAKQLLGRIVEEWPSIYREKEDGGALPAPTRTPLRSLDEAVCYSSSGA
jgi:hypothetical protein